MEVLYTIYRTHHIIEMMSPSYYIYIYIYIYIQTKVEISLHSQISCLTLRCSAIILILTKLLNEFTLYYKLALIWTNIPIN